MPASLTSLHARVDRLAARVRPSNLEVLDYNKMSDIELEWHSVRLTEMVIGPLATFTNFDDMATKYCAVMGGEIGTHRAALLSGLAEHMNRRWWFDAHRPHGELRVTWLSPPA